MSAIGIKLRLWIGCMALLSVTIIAPRCSMGEECVWGKRSSTNVACGTQLGCKHRTLTRYTCSRLLNEREITCKKCGTTRTEKDDCPNNHNIKACPGHCASHGPYSYWEIWFQIRFLLSFSSHFSNVGWHGSVFRKFFFFNMPTLVIETSIIISFLILRDFVRKMLTTFYYNWSIVKKVRKKKRMRIDTVRYNQRQSSWCEGLCGLYRKDG